jgi:poly(3-hydroxybutyrate) depolymerase
VSIDGMKVNSAKTAIDAMNNVVVGTEVAVAILRDDKPLDLKLIAERLPTNLVNELPPASRTNATTTTKPVNGTAVAKQEISLDELKLAEFTETCRVYLPSSAKAGQATGLLIWLHAPGEPPTEELFREWQSICDRDGLILVVPTAADTSRWDRTELEYLRRLTERVLAEYPVDRRRVVVFGQEGGGAMAYLLALVSQDLFTGVATSAAALPRTIDPPSAQPTTRLAVFAGLPANDSRRAQTQNGLKKLADAGYPVTVTTVANQSGKLSAEEREQLSRWLDSLDRF